MAANSRRMGKGSGMSARHFTKRMLDTLPALVRDHILEQRKEISVYQRRAEDVERQVRDLAAENAKLRHRIAELESGPK